MSLDGVVLTKNVTVGLTLGHLLFVWETMSTRVQDLKGFDELSENERRAIWGLLDLMENALVENGVTGGPPAEWQDLVNRAAEVVNGMSVDYLD